MLGSVDKGNPFTVDNLVVLIKYWPTKYIYKYPKHDG